MLAGTWPSFRPAGLSFKGKPMKFKTTFTGNCPKCHHLHQLVPKEFIITRKNSHPNNILCDRCKFLICSIGGTKRRLSIVSVETNADVPLLRCVDDMNLEVEAPGPASHLQEAGMPPLETSEVQLEAQDSRNFKSWKERAIRIKDQLADLTKWITAKTRVKKPDSTPQSGEADNDNRPSSDEQVRELRLKKTIAAKVFKDCICSQSCHCKSQRGFPSSLVPSDPLYNRLQGSSAERARAMADTGPANSPGHPSIDISDLGRDIWSGSGRTRNVTCASRGSSPRPCSCNCRRRQPAVNNNINIGNIDPLLNATGTWVNPPHIQLQAHLDTSSNVSTDHQMSETLTVENSEAECRSDTGVTNEAAPAAALRSPLRTSEQLQLRSPDSLDIVAASSHHQPRLETIPAVRMSTPDHIRERPRVNHQEERLVNSVEDDNVSNISSSSSNNNNNN